MHTTRRFLFLTGFLCAALTAARAQDYNVRDFGAADDTLKLSTAAINRAVEACARKGGGRVVIPAGNYKSGTIILKNNVELYLSAGATLYASTAPKDFPRQAQPAYRSQKDPGGWYALIYAEGARNIGLAGYGTIDGLGARQRPRPGPLGGDQDGRPRNVLFVSCQRVHVENITMQNSGVWNQHYLNCEDVKVTGIQVFNHSNRNNDGIDIDGCRRFVLANSIIDSDDDAVVLKSTGPASCEDVVVSNCVVSSFTNGLKCGTESTGGFKNISFANCVVKPSVSKTKSVFNTPAHGITAISLEIVDGGVMDGVQVSNITIEGTECPIYVRLGNRARKHRADAAEPPYGQMRNVSLSNITATHAGNYTSSITGVPGALIDNITLSNVRIVNQGGLTAGGFLADAAQVKEDEKGYPQPTVGKNLPAAAFFLRHVKQASFQHCSFASEQADPRQPFVAVDVLKLDLHEVTYNNKPL